MLRDKVFAGTLTKAGMTIKLGPDPTMFANQKLVAVAQTYQLYRLIAYRIIFETSLNQTVGNSNVCIWQSSDTASTLPTDDTAVKISSANSKGTNFFATQNKTYAPTLPQFKYNAFSTGGGDTSGGSAFEPACLVFVAITSPVESITNYGEVWVEMSLALSNPAPPQTSKLSNTAVVPKDEWIATIDGAMQRALMQGQYAKYLVTLSATNVYDLYETAVDADWSAPIQSHYVETNVMWATKTPIPMPTPNNRPLGDLHTWDATQKAWTKVGPVPTNQQVQLVQLTQPVVIGQNAQSGILESDNTVKMLSQMIQAVKLYHDNQMEVPVTEIMKGSDEKERPTIQVMQQQEKVPVTIKDQPVEVRVNEQPIKVDVQNQLLNVQVTNVPLEVEITQEVPVKIDDQPISVQESKSASDWFEEAAGAIIPFVLAEQQNRV